MFNSIYVGLLTTESPCTFLVCESSGLQASDIFRNSSPGYHLINLIHLIGVHLANEFTGFHLVIGTSWYP